MKKARKDNAFTDFRFRDTTMDGSTKYGYWYRRCAQKEDIALSKNRKTA
jgi:hypothetical protein